ncbi:ClbS/DfsB family four-helix bundle protein [Stenoxybacter acetivorans]|uniref:ClbS/DfsB family four-helix bundle protein n=1 Tax=Stenoxybacter acetivorans TaxID=422441 RepID=UPI00055F17E5|nr:ClbS/DfsB family four-helix bundle protein [Stenoxybacter acetivorans]
MPRPTTKSELILAANIGFDKLFALIDTMPQSNQTAPFCFDAKTTGKEAHWQRDKNIRDVLIHLHEWHKLLLNWVNANQHSMNQPFLPEPYNWKNYGEMNIAFWAKHQSTPYAQAREMLKDSHQAVLALIGDFSDKELFEKKHFSWTGTTSLGSYCISATSSHYDWAIKKIKMQIKALDAPFNFAK